MDKAKLLARGQNQERDTEEVQIGDLGVVTVRSLTRAEVKKLVDGEGKTDPDELVACALVDPVMTPEEVAQWLDGAPASDSAAVYTAVGRLNGFDEVAQKSSVSRNGKRGRRRV